MFKIPRDTMFKLFLLLSRQWLDDFLYEMNWTIELLERYVFDIEISWNTLVDLIQMKYVIYETDNFHVLNWV